MTYQEAFALRNKFREFVHAKMFNTDSKEGKDLPVTGIIVTPYGLLNKVCNTMREQQMTNEEALVYLEKTNAVYAVYVIHTQQETMIHINLVKYLMKTCHISLS